MPKTAMLASLLLLPLSGPALADLVSTAGDPFPAGSFFNITGQVSTPLGLVENMHLSNFNLKSIFQNGADQSYHYSADLFAQIFDPTTHLLIGNLDIQNPEFIANVSSRTVPDATGTFSLFLPTTDFLGNFLGHTVDVELWSNSGIATFVNLPNSGLMVDTSLTLNAEYFIDDNDPIPVLGLQGQSAASSPTAPGPTPGAGLAGLAALALAGFYTRARGT